MNVSDITGLGWAKAPLSNGLSRKLMLAFFDAIIFSLAIYLALLMLPGQFTFESWFRIWIIVAVVLIVKLPVFAGMGIYRISLSYLGLRDVARIIEAVTISSVIFSGVAIIFWVAGLWTFSIPMIITDYLITLFLIGGLRAARRMYLQVLRRSPSASLRRTLIAGAGSAGELTLRAILQEKNTETLPVGIIDDDPAKQGMTIHRVPVLGKRQDILRLVPALGIQELLITIPSAPSYVIKEFVKLGRQAGLKKIKVLPALDSLINSKVTVQDLHDIQVEDLLGRDPVEIETQEIEYYIKGEVVLVTGGAGSIGSELCQQIATFQPGLLVVLDQDETGLFQLRQNLKRRFPTLKLSAVVGDIQDKARVGHVFSNFKPRVVFHSAAYKHVSMMEENPAEAVKNNVLGTEVVGEAACYYGVDKFVLISTDKAVNPTCVMGATKRLAEIVVQNLNERNSCRFIAVRFGNVLGSRGSVVPIFREQIERGGPVTITHPEMRRYFMTPSEAALLVLQAGAIGVGGEVFVLDMGLPIAVIDLAREMIQLAGLEPEKDIPIVFTQPSPGEKLFEDILTAEEGTVATKHHRIYKARTNGGAGKSGSDLWQALEQLRMMAGKDNRQAILRALHELVPNFYPVTVNTYQGEASAPKPASTPQLKPGSTWPDIQGTVPLGEVGKQWQEKKA
jgi:FlaA1/EpsC-like NDP-sugar epimerase